MWKEFAFRKPIKGHPKFLHLLDIIKSDIVVDGDGLHVQKLQIP